MLDDEGSSTLGLPIDWLDHNWSSVKKPGFRAAKRLPKSPQLPNDILALQTMYGANYSTQENTVYSGVQRPGSNSSTVLLNWHPGMAQVARPIAFRDRWDGNDSNRPCC
jgi:hypothetical protein